MTISASYLTLLDFEQLFLNHCNITGGLYKGVGGWEGWGG